MKTALVRVVPIVVGGLLWLAGNSFMVSSPAHGQEVAGKYANCDYSINDDFKHSCPSTPTDGKCTGYYEYNVYTFKFCNDNDVTNMSPCQPATRDVNATKHYGYCVGNSNHTLCFQGDDIYSEDSIEYGAPWCNNGYIASRPLSPQMRIARG